MKRNHGGTERMEGTEKKDIGIFILSFFSSPLLRDLLSSSVSNASLCFVPWLPSSFCGGAA
jgi:hypothetical protein